ncbi:MAG: T9SS type A sorting domain-containing protein [Bacteroidales bacterium]|nr:T9SS type A sorting domain-containing protein [Bacteroidales bacterium]
MKTKYIIVLIICIAIGKNSISAQSLLDTTNIWSVLEYDNIFTPTHLVPSYKTIWYSLGNQFQIQNKKYYQLQYTTDLLHQNWLDTTIYLRQNNDIVYKIEYKAYSDSSEQKLYDFGMLQKDTMHFMQYNQNFIARVDSINDTLLYNIQRKLYYISNYSENDTTWIQNEKWIEGIGSLDGLLKDNCILCTGGSAWQKLLCMYSGEEIQYHDTAYSNCYYHHDPNSIEKFRLKANKLKLFPNPVKDYLYFEIPEKTKKEIRIYNLFGKLEKQVNSSDQKVNLSELRTGIYYIVITTDNNIKYSAKFVKD